MPAPFNSRFAIAVSVLACLVSGWALAADTGSAPGGPVSGDAAAGAAKAAMCTACHGATGSSPNPEWPNLAGQQPSYIAEQLALFKANVRPNALMQPMALVLADADVPDVAAYFASQAPTGREADAALVAMGQALYRAGDSTRGIPACLACHGPDGRGNGPARWPALRAQYATYAYNQLKAYAAKTRYVARPGAIAPPAQADMMETIAARLSDDEMRAVAAYLQGLR
jgi:cytochrome c553